MTDKKTRQDTPDVVSTTTDSSDAVGNDYAAFQPMAQAAASTASADEEPTRLLLAGLMLFALGSAGVLLLNGYAVFTILSNAVQGLPPALLAILVRTKKSLKWRAKYWLAARVALFVVSLALLSPIRFSINSLITSAAIVGGVLLVAYTIEYFFRRRPA